MEITVIFIKYNGNNCLQKYLKREGFQGQHSSEHLIRVRYFFSIILEIRLYMLTTLF